MILKISFGSGSRRDPMCVAEALISSINSTVWKGCVIRSHEASASPSRVDFETIFSLEIGKASKFFRFPNGFVKLGTGWGRKSGSTRESGRRCTDRLRSVVMCVVASVSNPEDKVLTKPSHFSNSCENLWKRVVSCRFREPRCCHRWWRRRSPCPRQHWKCNLVFNLVFSIQDWSVVSAILKVVCMYFVRTTYVVRMYIRSK